MARNVKKRNWTAVIYPESAPSDWREQLIQSGLMGAISPLHDKDIEPTGETKKAHYHIILCYPGPTTFNVVNSFISSLNQPIPKPIESIRGLYRYFTHKDNPDKYQYDDTEIFCFGGFDIQDYVELTKSETIAIIKKVQSYIRDTDIYEYSDLIDILDDNDMTDMYNVAITHTMLFSKYLESRRWKDFDKKEKGDKKSSKL